MTWDQRCPWLGESKSARRLNSARGAYAMVQGTADKIKLSGNSSARFATDDLDLADEISAISMMEDDLRQSLEEHENL